MGCRTRIFERRGRGPEPDLDLDPDLDPDLDLDLDLDPDPEPRLRPHRDYDSASHRVRLHSARIAREASPCRLRRHWGLQRRGGSLAWMAFLLWAVARA